jgi:hypothetical protein
MTDLQKRILEVVCSQTGVEVHEVLSDSKMRHITLAKHICMYVFKRKLGLTHAQIASLFIRNGKTMNHTSVLHAVNSIQNSLDVNEEIVARPTKAAMEYIDANFSVGQNDALTNMLLISFHPNFPVNSLLSLIKKHFPTTEYYMK